MVNYEDARTNMKSELGQLLWVRRRNGTWWPGQILSLDQVQKTCTSSRRSGTPIKLLGKDDAIIEWINIEKSNRIKAFRCGEFNECIEKVKASANNFSKRPEKYAKRGVAILHALQLEGEHTLEDKPQHDITELSSPLIPDEVDHMMEGPNMLNINSNLDHELYDYGVSYNDTKFEEQFTRKRKLNSPNNSKGVKEVGVGLTSKWGGQVEALSLGPQHYIDSGLATSGDVTAIILGNSTKTGSMLPDVDSESVTARRLLPYSKICPFPESHGGIYDSLSLYDVNVEVQKSYISQNVPFTFAKSGLNDHFTVGYSSNIDAVDYGFNDNLSSGVSKVPNILSSPKMSSSFASEKNNHEKIISKAEDPKNTFVACVPLSLIFSRINAALSN